MPKKGNKLTKNILRKLEIKNQAYQDILMYGCVRPFETLLVSFVRSVAPRTSEIEFMKFSHIDIENKKCILLRKWNRPKRPANRTITEHKNHIENLIQTKKKRGELIEFTHKGKKYIKRVEIGTFNDNVKKLLNDLAYEYKEDFGGDIERIKINLSRGIKNSSGYVFRKNKSSKYSLTRKSLVEMFHRLIDRTNDRLNKLGKKDRLILHIIEGERFRLHDLGRHSWGKIFQRDRSKGDLVAIKLGITIPTLESTYGASTIETYQEDLEELEKNDIC